MEIRVLGESCYVYTGGKKLTPEAVKHQRVVVFIHGAQQDHSCWTLQSRWFAHHGFSVIAPDLPGHGRSAGSPLTSIEAMADWLNALLETLEVEKVTIIGHSMGSLVALDFAVRFSQKTEKLVLIGTSLPMPVAPVLLNAARDNEQQAAEMINTWSYTANSQIGGNTVPGLWLLGVNKQLMNRQKKGLFFTDLTACNAYRRDLATLQTISSPSLIIAGSQDKMTSPKSANLLKNAIPHANIVHIAGGGHALMAERPDAVLDSLRGFI